MENHYFFLTVSPEQNILRDTLITVNQLIISQFPGEYIYCVEKTKKGVNHFHLSLLASDKWAKSTLKRKILMILDSHILGSQNSKYQFHLKHETRLYNIGYCQKEPDYHYNISEELREQGKKIYEAQVLKNRQELNNWDNYYDNILEHLKTLGHMNKNKFHCEISKYLYMVPPPTYHITTLRRIIWKLTEALRDKLDVDAQLYHFQKWLSLDVK